MFEKKKKRGHSSNQVLKFILGVKLVAFIIGLFIWMQFANETPSYPPPPEQVEISVSGEVVNEKGEPVRYNKVDVRVRAGGGDGGFGVGPFEAGSGINNLPVDSHFSGALYPNPVPNGCLRIYLDLEGYEKTDFEYGLQNIEWGADITVKITVGESGIHSEAVIAPSRIKPALAPEPRMQLKCGAS